MMMKNQFKIMYVAPRYHTNQVPVINGWLKSGARVKFMAAYTGVIESHEKVDFHQMTPSLLMKIMLFFMSLFYDEDRLMYLRGKYLIPSIGDLYSQLKSFMPDVIIIRNYSLMAIAFLIMSKCLGIGRVVIYLQTPLYGTPLKSNKLKDFIRNNFFSQAVFSPVLYKGSCRTKDKMTGRVKYYVPLVCDKPKNIKEEYCPDGKIRILDIGKYREYKNHFFVVDALSKVKHPERFDVTIIGQLSSKAEQDYHDRLERYIKEKHLENVIQLRGHVGFDEMDTVYANNDVLVLASKEPASISVLESMSRGLCVLGSYENGTTCYLDEYKCGISFPISQVDSLVEILDNISVNISLVGEFGQKAQRIASDEFCFDKYKDGLDNLLLKEYNYSIPV